MRITPAEFGWEYLDLRNLRVVPPDESIPFRFDLDPETIVRKQIVGRPSMDFTAWLHMTSLVSDLAEYHETQMTRLAALSKFRPALDRAVTYLLNRNWSQLLSELSAIRSKPIDSVGQGRIKLFESLEQYGLLFAPHLATNREFVHTSVVSAVEAHEKEVDKLASHFSEDGRIDALFVQLQSISKKWAELYPMLSGLDIIPYLLHPKPNIESDYTLAQKRFPELKGLYVDCFETLCRVSVIAGVFDGISQSGKAEVVGAKRPLSIKEFEAIPNGSKGDILKRLECGHLFLPGLEHSLRNGIGHHDAHYSLNDDMVYYANTSPKRGIERFSLPYITFCQKVAAIARLLDATTFYVYFLWLRSR